MSGRAASWMDRAACANRPDLPWTLDAADVTPWQAASMRAVCDACPVLFDCLAAVDDLDVTGGWWAGNDRDPLACTGHLNPPAWARQPDPAQVSCREPVQRPAAPATAADIPPSPAASLAPVAWVPVRGRRGRVLAEQAAFCLDGLGVA